MKTEIIDRLVKECSLPTSIAYLLMPLECSSMDEFLTMADGSISNLPGIGPSRLKVINEARDQILESLTFNRDIEKERKRLEVKPLDLIPPPTPSFNDGIKKALNRADLSNSVFTEEGLWQTYGTLFCNEEGLLPYISGTLSSTEGAIYFDYSDYMYRLVSLFDKGKYLITTIKQLDRSAPSILPRDNNTFIIDEATVMSWEFFVPWIRHYVVRFGKFRERLEDGEELLNNGRILFFALTLGNKRVNLITWKVGKDLFGYSMIGVVELVVRRGAPLLFKGFNLDSHRRKR